MPSIVCAEQLMYEAQFDRIEKIKIIGSTFMAACGLISGRKNSQDYDAATEQNTTEPFSKERLKETLSPESPNNSHSGLKAENDKCDVNVDFIKLMTSYIHGHKHWQSIQANH